MNPLRQKDYPTLAAVKQSATEHAEMLRKLQECGLPCEEAIKMNLGHLNTAAALLDKFPERHGGTGVQ